MRSISRVFIIGNGVAGAENQCFGLVRALGLSHLQTLHRVIRPKGGIHKQLQWLPVSLRKRLENVRKLIYGNSLPTQIAVRGQKLMPLPAERQVSSDIIEANAKHIATLSREAFAKDGPSLVVASGRDTISISSSIKQLAPEYVFTVQIQHPRSRLNRFDLVITPRHDYYPLTPEGQKQIPWLLQRWITPRTCPERHVILTVGALHQVDSDALKEAAYTWHDELANLLRPLLVVNVGGPTGHCKYGTDLALELTALLLNIVPTCGSIRVSFSRRTSCKVSDIIWEELGNHPKVHIWNGEGDVGAMFVFLSLAEENYLFNEKMNIKKKQVADVRFLMMSNLIVPQQILYRDSIKKWGYNLLYKEKDAQEKRSLFGLCPCQRLFYGFHRANCITSLSSSSAHST